MKFRSPEYLELRAFCEALLPLVHPEAMRPEVNPMRFLAQMEDTKPSHATRGLEMMVNDLLEALKPFSKDQIEQLDEALKKCGCLTVSRMRSRKQEILRR